MTKQKVFWRPYYLSQFDHCWTIDKGDDGWADSMCGLRLHLTFAIRHYGYDQKGERRCKNCERALAR